MTISLPYHKTALRLDNSEVSLCIATQAPDFTIYARHDLSYHDEHDTLLRRQMNYA